MDPGKISSDCSMMKQIKQHRRYYFLEAFLFLSALIASSPLPGGWALLSYTSGFLFWQKKCGFWQKKETVHQWRGETNFYPNASKLPVKGFQKALE